MKDNPILFLDSGIGGLPYCMDFLKKNPQETVYYLADNKNYPYGPKTKEEITSILTVLINKIAGTIRPKIIVLACNTATISALSTLRNNFPDIPFVGTVPAIKPAAEAAEASSDSKTASGNSGKIGVLGSERTIKEIHSLNLTEKTFEIAGIPAPDLIDFIELQYDDSKDTEKTNIVKKYVNLFRKEQVDTIVLGCTHFLFLQEEFLREAAPDIKVFDSIEGISKRIEFLLNEKNLRSSVPGQNKLLLTDKNINDFWVKRAQKLQFSFEVLDL